MGCNSSKLATNSVVEKAATTPAPVSPTATATDSSPKPDPPMAFAVMRNSHESFRGALKDIRSILTSPSTPQTVELFATAWNEYQRNTVVHAKIEDDCMFPLLSRVNGSDIGLSGEHDKDHELKAAVDDKLKAVQDAGGGAATDSAEFKALIESYDAWEENHVSHFKKEEGIMMPLTQKTAATPQARAEVVHKEIITPSLEKQGQEFTDYLGWCTAKLAKHGSGNQPAPAAVRVFVRAVHSASSASQWAIFGPVLEANSTKDIWSQILTAYPEVSAPVTYL